MPNGVAKRKLNSVHSVTHVIQSRNSGGLMSLKISHDQTGEVQAVIDDPSGDFVMERNEDGTLYLHLGDLTFQFSAVRENQLSVRSV
jgi:hypothetical protein